MDRVSVNVKRMGRNARHFVESIRSRMFDEGQQPSLVDIAHRSKTGNRASTSKKAKHQPECASTIGATVAQSSAEAELYALTSAANDLIHL
eukprot:1552282-Amphidinium_carterae.1